VIEVAVDAVAVVVKEVAAVEEVVITIV